MPEGPEVKRNAFALAKSISNKKIQQVVLESGRYTKKTPDGYQEYITSNLPDLVVGVGVHGKFMYIICSSGYNIWSTLGMTGGWSSRRSKHTRIALEFADSTSVFFNDIRNFGTIKFVYGKQKLLEKISDLGPDLLNPDTSKKDFILALRRKNSWNIIF